MKNLTGILVIVLLFGMVIVGCDSDSSDGTGGSGGPGGTGGVLPFSETPTWDINWSAYSIKFYTKTPLGVGSGSSESYKVGFTVTADGGEQTIEDVYVNGDRVEIIFGNGKTFTAKTVIKMSYDGTGGLAGKLAAFSNVTVEYDENMYAD